MGPAAAPAVQSLLPLLEHISELMRRETAETLGRIGPAAIEAVPALERVLERERNQNVRSAIRRALDKIRD